MRYGSIKQGLRLQMILLRDMSALVLTSLMVTAIRIALALILISLICSFLLDALVVMYLLVTMLIRITPITGSLLLDWAVLGMAALSAAFFCMVVVPPLVVIGVSAVACCMCLSLWRRKIKFNAGK